MNLQTRINKKLQKLNAMEALTEEQRAERSLLLLFNHGESPEIILDILGFMAASNHKTIAQARLNKDTELEEEVSAAINAVYNVYLLVQPNRKAA